MKIHTLASEDLSICVLPESGGAVTQGVFQGQNFLAIPPHPSIEPKFLGTEHDWLAAWNGGWQPLLPNAGGEYLEGKYPQGFHGNASQTSWSVLEKDSHSISLEWSDENLHSLRSINISESEVKVVGSVVNLDTEPRPLIVTEHLVLGSDFLKSKVTLEPVGEAQFKELEYDGTAKGDGFEPWESFQESNWSSVTAQTPARMGVFSGISCMRVINENYEIEISWDAKNLPYLWIWEEIAYTQEHPWNGDYLALGIEPSSASDGVGLGGDSAITLAVNEKFDWSVQLKIQKRASK